MLWAVFIQLDCWLRWWFTFEWAVSSESVAFLCPANRMKFPDYYREFKIQNHIVTRTQKRQLMVIDGNLICQRIIRSDSLWSPNIEWYPHWYSTQKGLKLITFGHVYVIWVKSESLHEWCIFSNTCILLFIQMDRIIDTNFVRRGNIIIPISLSVCLFVCFSVCLSACLWHSHG